MKVVCISGANRGIGLALTQQYSQTHEVIALCRKTTNELTSLPNTKVIENIDINDDKCRVRAMSELNKVDILILNAGILEPDQVDLELHEQSIQRQIQTNAISPLIMARLAIPKLAPQAKIMFMTSRMGSQEDNLSGKLDGYRMSKAALNTAGCNLAHELKDQEISVFLIHPGYIKTDMTHHQGRRTAEEAASNICKLLNNLTLDNTGQFWHSEAYQLPW